MAQARDAGPSALPASYVRGTDCRAPSGLAIAYRTEHAIRGAWGGISSRWTGLFGWGGGMKVSELIDADLDYWAARANGVQPCDS